MVYPSAFQRTDLRCGRASGRACGTLCIAAHHRLMAEPSEILLKKLPEIEQIIVSICRRKGMDADATEEFAAEVKLRLIERDYAIIRKFEGRSPFEVYIGAVVKRLLLDHQRHEWGKWRPSSEAQHLGPLAVDLERLLHRDGRSIEDALLLLQSDHPNVTRKELERIAVRLPVRVGRRKVNLEKAASVPGPNNRLDPARMETARRISTAVNVVIERLPEEDRLIFRMRFESGMTVAQVARALHLPQPLLYRRLYKRFDEFRAELDRAGIAAADVEDLIGTDTELLDFHLKNRDIRPSEEEKESAVAVRQEETSS